MKKRLLRVETFESRLMLSVTSLLEYDSPVNLSLETDNSQPALVSTQEPGELIPAEALELSELESLVQNAAEGDIIRLDAKTYTINAMQLVIDKQLTLIGAGKDTIIQSCNRNSGTEPFLIKIAADSVTIKNVTLAGWTNVRQDKNGESALIGMNWNVWYEEQIPLSTHKYLTLDSVYFTTPEGAYYYGAVKLYGAVRVTITNCVFEGLYDRATIQDPGEGMQILNNIFKAHNYMHGAIKMGKGVSSGLINRNAIHMYPGIAEAGNMESYETLNYFKSGGYEIFAITLSDPEGVNGGKTVIPEKRQLQIDGNVFYAHNNEMTDDIHSDQQNITPIHVGIFNNPEDPAENSGGNLVITNNEFINFVKADFSQSIYNTAGVVGPSASDNNLFYDSEDNPMEPLIFNTLKDYDPTLEYSASRANISGTGGQVGLADLSILAAAYGRDVTASAYIKYAAADLDYSGRVDLADLSILAQFYGKPVNTPSEEALSVASAQDVAVPDAPVIKVSSKIVDTVESQINQKKLQVKNVSGGATLNEQLIQLESVHEVEMNLDTAEILGREDLLEADFPSTDYEQNVCATDALFVSLDTFVPAEWEEEF